LPNKKRRLALMKQNFLREHLIRIKKGGRNG